MNKKTLLPLIVLGLLFALFAHAEEKPTDLHAPDFCMRPISPDPRCWVVASPVPAAAPVTVSPVTTIPIVAGGASPTPSPSGPPPCGPTVRSSCLDVFSKPKQYYLPTAFQVFSFEDHRCAIEGETASVLDRGQVITVNARGIDGYQEEYVKFSLKFNSHACLGMPLSSLLPVESIAKMAIIQKSTAFDVGELVFLLEKKEDLCKVQGMDGPSSWIKCSMVSSNKTQLKGAEDFQKARTLLEFLTNRMKNHDKIPNATVDYPMLIECARSLERDLAFPFRAQITKIRQEAEKTYNHQLEEERKEEEEERKRIAKREEELKNPICQERCRVW